MPAQVSARPEVKCFAYRTKARTSRRRTSIIRPELFSAAECLKYSSVIRRGMKLQARRPELWHEVVQGRREDAVEAGDIVVTEDSRPADVDAPAETKQAEDEAEGVRAQAADVPYCTIEFSPSPLTALPHSTPPRVPALLLTLRAAMLLILLNFLSYFSYY